MKCKDQSITSMSTPQLTQLGSRSLKSKKCEEKLQSDEFVGIEVSKHQEHVGLRFNRISGFKRCKK